MTLYRPAIRWGLRLSLAWMILTDKFSVESIDLNWPDRDGEVVLKSRTSERYERDGEDYK